MVIEYKIVIDINDNTDNTDTPAPIDQSPTGGLVDGGQTESKTKDGGVSGDKGVESSSELLEEELKAVNKKITGLESKLKEGLSVIANPSTIASKIAPFAVAGGPLGIVIAGIVTAALNAPAIVKSVIGVVSQKGWFLNRDYHDTVEEQLNSLFAREDIRARLLGESSAVVYSNTGFTRVSEGEVYNTKYNLSSARLSKVPRTYDLETYT